MADYPEWVLKYKKKGTYVNCVKGKYYLYAAHSERVPGTKKVRRVSDGYIGRITEADGLIPARDKVSGDVEVYECGLCMATVALCSDIAKGLRREHRGAADRIFVAGVMLASYGEYSQEAYLHSYLCVRFPNLDMGKPPTDKQRVAIERCARMAGDVFGKKFGAEAAQAARSLSRIHMVRVNGILRRSKLPEGAQKWLDAHGVELEVYHADIDYTHHDVQRRHFTRADSHTLR